MRRRAWLSIAPLRRESYHVRRDQEQVTRHHAARSQAMPLRWRAGRVAPKARVSQSSKRHPGEPVDDGLLGTRVEPRGFVPRRCGSGRAGGTLCLADARSVLRIRPRADTILGGAPPSVTSQSLARSAPWAPRRRRPSQGLFTSGASSQPRAERSTSLAMTRKPRRSYLVGGSIDFRQGKP
jgi:hypothetical protein